MLTTGLGMLDLCVGVKYFREAVDFMEALLSGVATLTMKQVFEASLGHTVCGHHHEPSLDKI